MKSSIKFIPSCIYNFSKKGNIPSITGLRPFFGSHLGHISFIKSLPSIKEGEQKLLFVNIFGGISG